MKVKHIMSYLVRHHTNQVKRAPLRCNRVFVFIDKETLTGINFNECVTQWSARFIWIEGNVNIGR